MDVIKKLGPIEVIRSGLSYTWATIKPKGKEENFEQWVTNRFGKRLFKLFFKSYTEKVWGVPTTEIRAEWAAQRIKGLSFFERRQGRVLRQQGQQGQVADRQVPLPALRARADVGADDARHRGAGRRGAAGDQGDAASSRIRRAGRVVRIVAGDRSWEPGEVISSLELRATVGLTSPDAPDGRAEGRAGPALPRLHHRRARARRRGPVPGQLDLHPRARRPGRPHPELPLLVAVDGPRRHQGVHRHGVLRLRRRRAVDDGRRQARRAGHRGARSRSAWPSPARSPGATPCACPRPTRCTTPTTPTASTRSRSGCRGSRTCSRSGATGCTATTTRTTRC